MVLDLKMIQAVTCGAAYVQQTDNGLLFYRLNREQMAYYQENNINGYYGKAKTTSGIRLTFKTDSRSLRMDLTMDKVMGRSYGAVEILVNGNRIGALENFSGKDLTGNFAERAYPCGRLSGKFDLGAGEKTVDVVFPRLIGIILHSIALDDGASVIPVKPSKKALVFGDSITQGFDCLWPTSHYLEYVCRALDAQEFNKAIGGERHSPHLVARAEDFKPDYILVGFGTNDWRCETVEDFLTMCRKFYENLATYYPGVPVIAITPVWRADMEAVKDIIHFGPIHEIEQYVREITAPYGNVTVVRGYEFIPEDPNMFGDLRLHPNDEGFAHYGKNLLKALNL